MFQGRELIQTVSNIKSENSKEMVRVSSYWCNTLRRGTKNPEEMARATNGWYNFEQEQVLEARGTSKRIY